MHPDRFEPRLSRGACRAYTTHPAGSPAPWESGGWVRGDLMTTTRSRAARRLTALLITLAAAWPVAAEEQVDLATIHRIKEEAFENSKVMDHLFYLTDVNGP